MSAQFVRKWPAIVPAHLPSMRLATRTRRSKRFVRPLHAGSNGWLHLWDLEGPTKIQSLRGQLLHVHWITFSPDGRRLVIGSGEGTAKIWDMPSLLEVATLRPEGQQRPLLVVQFSSSGESLVAVKKNAAFVWTPQRDLRHWPMQ